MRDVIKPREGCLRTLIENARLRGKTNSQVKVGVSYTKSQMRFYKKKKRDQRKGDWYRRKTTAPIDKNIARIANAVPVTLYSRVTI